MKANDLAGIIPAVIVPMREDGSIDFAAYRSYLEWVIRSGPVGLALNVDTGEGPYLTSDERAEVIRFTAKVAAGRVQIIAGCGGPSTANAIANARAARDAGADALLVFPTPAFLNDPFDPAIAVNYHSSIADASGLPIVLFQLGTVFGGVNYTEEALDAMMKIPAVIGIKDASFDPIRFNLVRDVALRQDRKITLLTGNDNFILESFLMGAEGGLLGYAAVGVGLLVEQLQFVQSKSFDQAQASKARVQGFCDYIYGRPIGDYRARCKVALVHMGLLSSDQTFVRAPYLSLWEQEKDRAAKVVEKYGLTGIARTTC